MDVNDIPVVQNKSTSAFQSNSELPDPVLYAGGGGLDESHIISLCQLQERQRL